ncbi:6-bladed beta-propeller [candidate division KSB1 bacterium]
MYTATKIAYFTIFLFIIACGNPDREQSYTTEIINGVRYVHNIKPEYGERQLFELKKTGRIGSLDGIDENYMLYRPYDLAFDKDSNVYVLDKGNFRIQKYDADGRYVSTTGSRGMGPGEFENPMSLDVDSDNNLYISEHRKFIRILNSSGNEIRRLYFDPFHPSDRFIITSSDRLVNNVQFMWYTGDGDVPEYLMQMYDLYGILLKEFCTPRIYENEKFNRKGNLIQYTEDRSGNFWIAFSYQNRIEKYSPDGKLLLRIDRELPYEESEEEEIITEKVAGYDASSGFCYRFAYSIACDKENRIWVWTPVDQERSFTKHVDFAIEVYSESGILLTRFFSEDLTLGSKNKINNGILYVLDTHKEMCIYKYSIDYK